MQALRMLTFLILDTEVVSSHEISYGWAGIVSNYTYSIE